MPECGMYLSVYVLGDLHLSLGVDKKMDVFGENWENYTQKIHDNWMNTVSDNDTVILCGDTSWGMNLTEALPDFEFLENLPGKKILLKGNHDYWWNSVKKMKDFFAEHNLFSFDILHNNDYVFDNIGIAGTRGWFYGESSSDAEDAKIIHREAERLKFSIEKALTLNSKRITCFLHYPPINSNGKCDEIFNTLIKYSIERCFYGHIHSKGIKYAVTGVVDGIDFSLISCDSIGFQPQLI
jgi:predicted phosphohydrolase